MRGYRINERNIGHTTLGGEPKKRGGRKSKVLTIEEKVLAHAILDKVYNIMEYDDSLEACTDGGRFTCMIDADDMDVLKSIISKL